MPSMLSRDRNRMILLSASAGLVQRVAQILTALLTLPVALHVLGVAGFGVWGAATSLIWLVGLLDLGMGSALVTLVPQALATGRPEQARAHVLAALFGGTMLGGVILLASAVVLGNGGHAMLPFAVAGIGLAFNVPLSIAQNVWFGLQKGYVAGVWDLLQTVLTLLLMLAAAAAGGGVTALVAAAYGGLVLANAGSLVHLLVSRPNLRPVAWRSSAAELRMVLTPGSLLFGIGICSACGYVFDNILALDWLGPAAAAQTAVAMRVCTTAAAFLSVLTQSLWPAFVEAAALDDRTWEWRSLTRGTLAVTICAAGGAALLVKFGEPALRLWVRMNLHLSNGLFWAMGAWIVMLGVPRVAALLLNAVSVLRFQLVAASLAGAAALCLKFFLARHFGVTGIVAAAPFAWAAIIWPSYAWRVWRWIARPHARQNVLECEP